MKNIAKALTGTVAAGAMVVSAASPAMARDRHHDHDGISAGDVIAGALIIGGIAAVAAAASDNDRDYRYDGDRYYRDYDGRYDPRYRYDSGYGYRNGSPRRAVEQCVRAAERNARRYSYGRADVTDIREVRPTRWGYEVRGRIAVNVQRGWRNGDSWYGNGWDGDYRGWNRNLRGYDSGRFSCKFERGRVVDLDYRGIRGL